jgi:hypothetical protein
MLESIHSGIEFILFRSSLATGYYSVHVPHEVSDCDEESIADKPCIDFSSKDITAGRENHNFWRAAALIA